MTDFKRQMKQISEYLWGCGDWSFSKTAAGKAWVVFYQDEHQYITDTRADALAFAKENWREIERECRYEAENWREIERSTANDRRTTAPIPRPPPREPERSRSRRRDEL